MMIVKESNSREDTYRIGRELGEQAAPGQVFCFFGDLGVGKTIFSQGFAKGLGVDDIVNSPTFTIVKEYDDGRLPSRNDPPPDYGGDARPALYSRRTPAAADVLHDTTPVARARGVRHPFPESGGTGRRLRQRRRGV